MTPRPRTFTAAAAGVVLAALSATVTASPAHATPISPLLPTAAPGSFTEQNLASDRTSQNFFYRIPSLASLGNGVVVAAWDGRPGSAGDSPNPNSIVTRRSIDSGATWGPITTIAAGHVADGTGPQYGYSDSSLVVDSTTGTVFAFSVYSKDQGFAGGQYGNDDADRNIVSAVVTSSTDGGLTWGVPRLITSVVKPGSSKTNPQPGDVRSMFASSGEGIQLTQGPHAGRLIQQYAGYVRQANGTEQIQAWSVYSDDHGATWTKGQPVGTGMDENKVVELSDGRVMLNSRDSAGSKFRKVAISTDGGQTYGPVTVDKQLIDPTNNGSITRLFPGAAPGSADARKVLFTNSADQVNRVNVSARVSCDDGATWPGLRSIRAGSAAYSTATRLGDGQIGVFYEASSTNDLELARFDDAWLNYVCAPLSTPDLTVQAGTTTNLPVTITNEEATTLSGGQATIATPTGWTAPSVTVPDIAPGAAVTVTVPLTAPANATGAQRLDATFTAADGRTSHYGVVVTAAGANQVGLTITGAAPVRDVVASPYAVGEALPYTLTVTSTANVMAASVPLASNLERGFLPPTAPNCRFLTLAAGARYTCTPSHVLTTADVDKGWFVPTASFTITATSDATITKTVAFTGAPVFLRDPATVPLGATIVGQRGDAGRDLATSPYAAGDLVPYTFNVANTAPFVETVVPTSGGFAPFIPPGPGNCRFTNLGIGGSYACTTPRHTVTSDEADAGFFRATSAWTVSATGKATIPYAVDGGEVDLKVRQPALNGTVTPTWLDVDGDRYASVGDRIDVTSTLGNAGNVSLTGVDAPALGVTAGTLALGASVSGTSSITLTAADIAAGTIQVSGFSASGANGSLTTTTTVDPVTVALDVKPAMPTTAPPTPRLNTNQLDSPIDLGLADKYRAGQLLVAHNLAYGQWYYLYANKTGQRFGWFFPTLEDTVELILPADTKNGADDLIVLDSSGARVAFDGLHVTPKGQ